MATAPLTTCYCERCNRSMRADEFYGSNNLEKYPTGKLTMCKKCLTAHVDNWNPETYLWILEEVDVPYVPDEWNKLMANYARPGSKLTGVTIIGRYFSKMKLKQYKDYRWKDTQFLQNLANNKLEQAMKQQGYSAADIAQAINKANTWITPDMREQDNSIETITNLSFPGETGPIEEPTLSEDEYIRPSATKTSVRDTDFEEELSDEDKIYLRLKWGKHYKAEEWIKLEQLYNEMMNSYDIQAAGDINTLKLACKCSLKSNQLLDIGD